MSKYACLMALGLPWTASILCTLEVVQGARTRRRSAARLL